MNLLRQFWAWLTPGQGCSGACLCKNEPSPPKAAGPAPDPELLQFYKSEPAPAPVVEEPSKMTITKDTTVEGKVTAKKARKTPAKKAPSKKAPKK